MARGRHGADRLVKARRVVVKIGSALLVDQASGRLHRRWLDALCDDIAMLAGRGQEVVLVSSGAIALGARVLKPRGRRLNVEDSQAAAAVGQIRLAHAYVDSLRRHRIAGAQILLTATDTEQRRRHLNARATITKLLAAGAVPVINENDSVATAEICYGDNDRLAARVAQMIGADCLVLLSDVDGLYSADPAVDPAARLIPEVTTLSPEIEAMAGPAKRRGVGSGGMIAKLAAARIATAAGCAMAIVRGDIDGPLRAFEKTGRGTWFKASAQGSGNARKKWIGASLRPAGGLTVDDGAVAALAGGASLLPAGVIAVAGSFGRGDVVTVSDEGGREIGRGLTAYGDADARLIMGHNSAAIGALLGYRGGDEMIHRDNLVLARGDAITKGSADEHETD